MKEMVEIADNYLLAFLAAVFIPTFIYLIKMVMEVGSIKFKFDGIRSELDLRIKEICKDIEKIQKELDNIFSRFDYRYGYGSRKGEDNEKK
jgi:hypothetical protein